MQKLYEKTLLGDTEFINSTLDANHDDLVSSFDKSDEDVVSLVFQISYTYAKRFHDIQKESTTIRGRSDFYFLPSASAPMPWLIELKHNGTAGSAIRQIKKKRYADILGSYKGKVLLLGINCNEKTMKHTSKVEIIEI